MAAKLEPALMRVTSICPQTFTDSALDQLIVRYANEGSRNEDLSPEESKYLSTQLEYVRFSNHPQALKAFQWMLTHLPPLHEVPELWFYFGKGVGQSILKAEQHLERIDAILNSKQYLSIEEETLRNLQKSLIESGFGISAILQRRLDDYELPNQDEQPVGWCAIL
jgi:hypothetical protein